MLVIVALVFVFILDNKFRVLPVSIHGHSPAHYPGFVVTDVTVASCSTLNIFSSCRMDSDEWHRIEKDLLLGSGWTSELFVYIKRKKEADLLPDDKIVLDLRISRLDPATGDSTQHDMWESRPGGIWLHRTSDHHASDSEDTVTFIDVLFGADAVDPRPNWEVKDTPLLLGSTATEARLSVRRGPQGKIEKPVPRIGKDSKFKIMQLADLHLSTGVGICRDPYPPHSDSGRQCDADPRTLEFVERLIEDEEPDLVVLSGDQVNGETAPDAQSALFKIADLLARYKLPYVAIFGNHDDEGDLDRASLMSLMQQLPYSMSEPGPPDVDGVGNYIVEVLGRGSSTNSALSLYLLDTHSYSPDERQFRGYDWLKPSQIKWFKNTAQSREKAHNEYTHIHMNLAFIHIPLPEYTNPNNYYKGNWTEPPTAPGFNSGFKDALVDENIVLVSCGQ